MWASCGRGTFRLYRSYCAGWSCLIGGQGRSDTRSMTDDALQLLLEECDYATLLEAYERAEPPSEPQTEDDLDAGWVSRLTQVAGIEDARLAPMHGKLIAHGLLSFQLTGRTSGVVYRVSADGRAALRRLADASPDRIAADDEIPADAAA